MKKTISILVFTAILLNAKAQSIGGYQVHQLNYNSKNVFVADGPANNSPVSHHGARTTSVTIATENFGTGTDSTLPTGWTSGIINGTGSWHWSDWASTSANSMGLMNSTSAANGWMIFDADSIQNDCGCSPSAWLQSPAYNCSGHTTVRLNFEEFYGNIQDTTQVWVSTDPTFTTYTVYSIPLNDAVTFFGETANVALIHINITAAAGGAPAVYIRYVYYGDNFLDLSWMIDDMSLTELNPHDAGISNSFMLAPDPSAYNGSVFNTPLVFVDSFLPGTLLSNYGANAETNVPVIANIYNGGTNVYSRTSLYSSLPYNALDSATWFPAFQPVSTGNYICALNAALPGDGDSTNNLDTVTFNITDTTWMQNDTIVNTNYFAYIAAGTFMGMGASASMLGTRFDVPSSSVGDTVSGFGVAFSPLTAVPIPGGTVSIQLYSIHKGDTLWTYQGTSVSKPITASDTSSFAAVKWDDFRIDTAASGGIAPFVLQPGTSYAAVLQLNNIDSNVLLLASSVNPIPGLTGSFFISDNSDNNGDHNLHYYPYDTVFNPNIAFIRMYFGPVSVNTGVKSLTLSNSVGAAYPDPANSSFSIPFTVSENTNVTVTLTDLAGQVIGMRNLQAISGRAMKATFTTGDLPSGLYIYCVDVGGQLTNGQIAVTH